MASSASIISPPTENPSNSDMDIGSEDTEYEEVEVEVEEEVEVEVEIEDQGNEIGEDLTPIRQENGQGKFFIIDFAWFFYLFPIL